MQLFRLIAFTAILLGPTYAALNGPCSVDGTPGVCVSTASCKHAGGTSHRNFCPFDPDDIRCCTKVCADRGAGICNWVKDCKGETLTGLCPGPSGFKCCLTRHCTCCCALETLMFPF
jgi:lysozyme